MRTGLRSSAAIQIASGGCSVRAYMLAVGASARRMRCCCGAAFASVRLWWSCCANVSVSPPCVDLLAPLCSFSVQPLSVRTQARAVAPVPAGAVFGLPFHTNFDVGVGLDVFREGRPLLRGPWSNLSCTSTLPTCCWGTDQLSYCLPGSPASNRGGARGDGERRVLTLSMSPTFESAFDGGACLVIKGT